MFLVNFSHQTLTISQERAVKILPQNWPEQRKLQKFF
jgi:hypothetical protein